MKKPRYYRRYSDNDLVFGPLTVCRNRWHNFEVEVTSGGGDDDGDGGEFQNALFIHAFNWTIRLYLPNLIRPFRQWVQCDWDRETVARLGRNGYWKYWPRDYGFQLYEGDSFSINYGINQGFQDLPNGVKEARKHWFLPWMQWRKVRHSLYDLSGKLFWSEPDTNRMTSEQRRSGRNEWYKKKDECPKLELWFEDYDGELIKATCHIEEREWRRGEKWCSWMSVFFKRKIRRDLELWFSAEVGPEKGSWKGGTIGHSIEMMPGELHESAFRRYCEKDHERKGRTYRLKFLGRQKPAGVE